MPGPIGGFGGPKREFWFLGKQKRLLGGICIQQEQVLLRFPRGLRAGAAEFVLGGGKKTGVPVAGLVDVGLAACSLEPAPARVLHLDLELNQAILTVLDHTGHALKRSRYEIAQRQGVLALQQTWMQFIAEQFVRKTRFDPLHDASAEQRLFDQLPGWLSALAQTESITLPMQFGDRLLEIELTREQFESAVDAHYRELLQLVQGARVAGMPIELRVSERVAALPGLLARFNTLRECIVQILPAGAAALGALKYAASIQRAPDALALVYQLPTPRSASSSHEVHDAGTTPAQLRPTHVLFQGRAWLVSEQPLVVGWAVDAGKRGLALPAAAPGVSRAHCTIVRRNGAVTIEDHSTYGSYVNDERVAGRTVLTVGDRVRLGAPGSRSSII